MRNRRHPWLGCGLLVEIRAAMAFHLQGLAADAEPQPPVCSSVALAMQFFRICCGSAGL
jgi:hypothetical protein